VSWLTITIVFTRERLGKRLVDPSLISPQRAAALEQ
jgi:hypothetical protein